MRTLHETSQHLTPRLQERVPDDYLQKPLQPFPPVLDHVVAEAVREHLPRQRGDCDARAFPLEDVAEVFEVRVAAADGGVFQLEGGDVGSAHDLVGGVHVAGCTVRLRVFYLSVIHIWLAGEWAERIVWSTSISRKFSGGP